MPVTLACRLAPQPVEIVMFRIRVILSIHEAKPTCISNCRLYRDVTGASLGSIASQNETVRKIRLRFIPLWHTRYAPVNNFENVGQPNNRDSDTKMEDVSPVL